MGTEHLSATAPSSLLVWEIGRYSKPTPEHLLPRLKFCFCRVRFCRPPCLAHSGVRWRSGFLPPSSHWPVFGRLCRRSNALYLWTVLVCFPTQALSCPLVVLTLGFSNKPGVLHCCSSMASSSSWHIPLFSADVCVDIHGKSTDNKYRQNTQSSLPTSTDFSLF